MSRGFPGMGLKIVSVFRFSRERTGDVYGEMYYKVLAHMILEAEKSLSLPFAKWRLRKASGVV